MPAGNRIRGFDGIRVGILGIDGLRRAGVAAGGVVPAPEPAGGDQSHAGGEQGDCRCDHALDGGAGVGEPGPVTVVFCQVVIGQCGVSFPSEKAVGFSPVRNWPVIARVLLFHCIRA